MFVCIIFSLSVEAQTDEVESRDLDIVFCLDLSGSTNGLIDNVRENIWGIVNMTAQFQPSQKLRIGVVGYSRPSFGKINYYIKILSQLTGDFDQMQFELYKLRSEIEKGDQFVSNALETALTQMRWSKSDGAVKIIFLIGNGSLSTGTTDYRSVAGEIVEQGIHLIPVYCLRSKPTPDQDAWQQLGRISGFDCEKIVVVKRDPLLKQLPDQEKITNLNKRLDQLMVPVSNDGLEICTAIKSCDSRAMLYHPVSYENRLYYRISDALLQQTLKWDLVAGDFQSLSLEKQYNPELFPDSLKNIPQQKLIEKIEASKTERSKIINELKKMLPDDRQHFINSVLKDKTFEKQQILERVLLLDILEVAGKNGIKLN